jgi:7 transmembrane helices usually fused to an inactive transglutaminase
MRSDELYLPGDRVIKRTFQAMIGLVVATFFAIMWALFDNSDTLITQAVHAVFGDPGRPWNLPQLHLLLALPLGAVMVVFARSVLGWKTFGLFTPMLLALAYLQSGPFAGPVISTAAILIGMAAAPLLKLLNLSRVAFLGTLIAIVVTALGTLALRLDNLVLMSAFPVVVTALVVERWWNAWEADGRKQAMKMTATTLALALMIQALVASPLLIALGQQAPLVMPASAILMMIVLGRYQGLRLSELTRFRAAEGA